MSDWQKGDLAWCVNTGPIYYPDGSYASSRPQLTKGKIYNVTDVGEDGDGIRLKPALFLLETRSASVGGGFAQERFVKVTPSKEMTEDEATIRELNGQPVRETV